MQRGIVIGGNGKRRPDSHCSGEPEYTRSELDALVSAPFTPWDDHCADELLEWIEESDDPVRFVPDWSESYKNAA